MTRVRRYASSLAHGCSQLTRSRCVYTDDELQNVNLAEYARTKERLDIQKKGKSAYKYTGYDDEDFEAASSGKQRGVLSKYNEVTGESDAKDEGFRIGSSLPSNAGASTSRAGQNQQEHQRELNRDLLSLDYSKLEQKDYLQEGDVGFKVKKKKKSKAGKSSSRRTAIEADEADPVNDVDVEMENGDSAQPSEPAVPSAERRLAKEGSSRDSVFDDEDLQAALARQRRLASKGRLKHLKGEDVARQILAERAGSSTPAPNGDAEMYGARTPLVKKEEDAEPQFNEAEEDDRDGGGLVLDDTSEFIRNISARPIIAKRDQARPARASRVKPEPQDHDVPLDELETNGATVEEEEPEEGEAVEEEEEDAMMLDRAASEDVKPDIKAEEQESDNFGSTADEKFVSGGMASTLSLLRQSGQLKSMTPEELAREKGNRERERFIAEARMRDAHRELDRQKSRAAGASKDQAQREYDNKQRQYEYAQQQLEAFRNYKPNVEISYTDEFGRNMTPKEAWKDLSHKFHGKGSGTNKREKLLKKIEDERKREAMSSGDTPLSATAAFQARQERMGSATMVIGVGNKKWAIVASRFRCWLIRSVTVRPLRQTSYWDLPLAGLCRLARISKLKALRLCPRKVGPARRGRFWVRLEVERDTLRRDAPHPDVRRVIDRLLGRYRARDKSQGMHHHNHGTGLALRSIGVLACLTFVKSSRCTSRSQP